MRKVSDKSCG